MLPPYQRASCLSTYVPQILLTILCTLIVMVWINPSSSTSSSAAAPSAPTAARIALPQFPAVAAPPVAAPFPGICDHTSPYVLERLSSAAEPECRSWLASGSPVDTFTSQIGQDAFMYENFFRCMDGPGTYLDIGAFDPRLISNTWFLDKCLGWRGICAEGNPAQAQAFRTTRSCHLIDKVVSMRTGEITFQKDGSSGTVIEAGGKGGEVLKTITLGDAIAETGWLAPGETGLRIDFLSLDVEYHELEVLLAIPWDRVDIRFAAIENNKNFLDNFEFLMRFGFVKIATISIDEIFMRVEGAKALWLPGDMNKRRMFDSKYRRDNFFAPVYLHSTLYDKGWDYLIAYAKEHFQLPPP